MRIVENNTQRLVLKGTPGSLAWMVFATLLGVAVMTACGWFGWATFQETSSLLQLVPMAIGLLLGLAFFLIGLVTLAFGRMRLELDRVTGDGRYDVYSPIVEVGKPFSFRLVEIDSVTLERSAESRPRTESAGGFPADVCRARLRIRKPRRAIVLDETENGREARVQAVAQGVADWLDLDMIEKTDR